MKKNIKPDVRILYVKPERILNNRWPDIIFALKRKPREILRAMYEINSIKTKRGSKPKGHPAGTNKEKNSKRCFCNPSRVAPNTTVKLRENVRIKWEVEAKL